MEEVLNLFKEKHEARVSSVYKVYMAFLRRAKIRLNYKTWMLFDFATTMFNVFTYFLLSFIILPQQVAKAGYGYSYFTFAVIGLAASHYITAGLRSLALTIRLEQFYGTIESILSTPTDFIVLFLGDLLYYVIYSSVFLVMILPLGIFLGAQIVINIYTIITLLILILLLVLSNLPIGILSAAMVLKFKQGDPIGWALTWINQLFGGTFFPITLLPTGLRILSYGLPLTYALDAIRYSLVWGASLTHPRILNDVLAMIVYTIIGYPIAIKVFRMVYKGALKEGKLGIY
ncbi:MAG: ABC transporter permease [Candidatus Njordarchaeales archaeon]